MTAAVWIGLTAFMLLAKADWIAVAAKHKAFEYLAKPAALLALIATALALRPELASQRAWFVAALVASLAGDVFLMLPRNLFIAGLASFLVAHLAYTAGFVAGGLEPIGAAFGIALVVAAMAVFGVPILRHVRAKNPQLSIPVAAYMVVISAMVVAAGGSRNVLAVAGAMLFFASDALIAWNRFVRALAWAPVTIMVTYHLGQAGLVLSLL